MGNTVLLTSNFRLRGLMAQTKQGLFPAKFVRKGNWYLFNSMCFFQSQSVPKYRSITSFSVDWPRTIRLVCASVSILSVCTMKLQIIENQKRCTSITKTTTPEKIRNGWQKSFIGKNLVVRHVTRPCPCITTSIVIKITKTSSLCNILQHLQYLTN